jgi:hypothetical protein
MNKLGTAAICDYFACNFFLQSLSDHNWFVHNFLARSKFISEAWIHPCWYKSHAYLLGLNPTPLAPTPLPPRLHRSRCQQTWSRHASTKPPTCRAPIAAERLLLRSDKVAVRPQSLASRRCPRCRPLPLLPLLSPWFVSLSLDPVRLGFGLGLASQESRRRWTSSLLLPLGGVQDHHRCCILATVGWSSTPRRDEEETTEKVPSLI